MRGFQASFASGEISPLLHGRIDLSRYSTGLSRLENMIVLPQGGVTRRAGFTKAGTALDGAGIRLIPFVYNATDSVILEFWNNHIRVWGKSGTGYAVVSSIVSPYSSGDVKDLRYVQSGNVIFLAHRKYKPMMLTRESMTSWRLEELAYHDGPFISGSEMYPGVKLSVLTEEHYNYDALGNVTGKYYVKYLKSNTDIFSIGLLGSLMGVEYAVSARVISFSSATEAISEDIEVKGTINVSTSGGWTGTVSIYRNDVLMKQYLRNDPETQGQWDITISETEENAYYHVKYTSGGITEKSKKAYTVNGSMDFDMTPVIAKLQSLIKATNPNLSAETVANNERTYVRTLVETSGRHHGYEREQTIDPVTGSTVFIYRDALTKQLITSDEAAAMDAAFEGDIVRSARVSAGTVDVKVSETTVGTATKPITVMISTSGFMKKETYRLTEILSGKQAKVEMNGHEQAGETEIKFWSIGAWNGEYGYPCAVSMYQDRLIFAGSQAQPQTIWMSKTGDYTDFGTSDPLKDDDAINITLAGSSSDGIHSIVSAGSLLAFTRSGEWQIRGNSEGGAITPSALSAHETTTIGSKNIQPLVVNGKIILIQAQGQKVYALGYDLNTDGYTGSELSVMSGHIFEGKEITSMAYQKTPDSLLWFSLSDGTAAVCTYNPEHEVIGWSRQSNPGIKFEFFSCVPSETYTVLFADSLKGNERIVMYSRDRTKDADYRDDESEYESVMQTLRITGSNEDGVSYASKKLISRLVVYALKSKLAWVSPKDWERRQKIRWNETDGLRESEIELDNGFDSDACIQIRNAGNESFTIAAISPVMTVGG